MNRANKKILFILTIYVSIFPKEIIEINLPDTIFLGEINVEDIKVFKEISEDNIKIKNIVKDSEFTYYLNFQESYIDRTPTIDYEKGGYVIRNRLIPYYVKKEMNNRTRNEDINNKKKKLEIERNIDLKELTENVYEFVSRIKIIGKTCEIVIDTTVVRSIIVKKRK